MEDKHVHRVCAEDGGSNVSRGSTATDDGTRRGNSEASRPLEKLSAEEKRLEELRLLREFARSFACVKNAPPGPFRLHEQWFTKFEIPMRRDKRLELLEKEIEGLKQRRKSLPEVCEFCHPSFCDGDPCMRCEPVLKLTEEFDARIERLEKIQIELIAEDASAA